MYAFNFLFFSGFIVLAVINPETLSNLTSDCQTTPVLGLINNYIYLFPCPQFFLSLNLKLMSVLAR
jgi:hypothetical protein